MTGIVERNVSAINDGLKLMVENHKSNKKFEDTADELVSIPALGFGKLAELKGLRVDLDDVVAPYIVLNKNIIDYPNLDYLGGYLNSAE